MKKTNNPLVSVCISIYNNEEFIEQAIESVLALTFWYKALAEAKGNYINLLPVEMTTSQSDHFFHLHQKAIGRSSLSS